jgi:hypothetical protein
MVAYELRLGGVKKLCIKYLMTERRWKMCVFEYIFDCVSKDVVEGNFSNYMQNTLPKDVWSAFVGKANALFELIPTGARKYVFIYMERI